MAKEIVPSPISAAHSASDKHGRNWNTDSLLQLFEEYIEEGGDDACIEFQEWIDSKAEEEAGDGEK